MAYHAIDIEQVDEKNHYRRTMQVAFTKKIGEFKTHRCAFDFVYKIAMRA